MPAAPIRPVPRRLVRHLPATVAALALTLAAGFAAADEAEGRRIVSIGGAVTEILYALGEEERIAAVDSTSQFPEAAGALPNVGYMRQLSAEGVLSTDPDLILAQEGAGPPDAIAILERSGVPYVAVPDAASPEGVIEKVRAVGAAVGAEARAAALAGELSAAFEALSRDVAAIPAAERRRVLFVLSLANGRVTAAGRGTSAAAIIEMAGGVNAAADFEGFKPMVDEAVIAAAPDVVLVMRRGEHALSAEEIFALPAFRTTPAAAASALIGMDALYLLGFGPRTPAAARDLAAALHPRRIAPAGRS